MTPRRPSISVAELSGSLSLSIRLLVVNIDSQPLADTEVR